MFGFSFDKTMEEVKQELDAGKDIQLSWKTGQLLLWRKGSRIICTAAAGSVPGRH